MKKLIFGLLVITIAFTACEDTNFPIDTGLTEAEVIAGLKQALTIGTDTAVSIVSKQNGYYMDQLIRINLPPEADIIVNNADNPLLQAIGVNSFIEDMVLKMNRAAEDAATEATPIFIDAITSMTIQDGFAILNGEDTAATHYLREKTYVQLQTAFQPKIATSLEKPIVAGVSASDTWSTFTSTYNQVAESLPGQIAGLQPVNTELDAWVTQKGLDGLFIKVSDEEKDIRTNVSARVTDLLQRVFGGG